MSEKDAQKDVTEWLEKQLNVEIYWDEGNYRETFEFRGVDVRPDVLSVGSYNCVIELKDGDDSSNIYDAVPQLANYWEQYEFGDATVRADGSEIDVDAFLIATQHSREGRLFKEGREGGERKTYDESEYWERGSRPQYEYRRSEALVRVLWRVAWNIAESRYNRERTEIDTGLGILLSDSLDSAPNQTQLGPSSSEPKRLIYEGERGSVWEELRSH